MTKAQAKKIKELMPLINVIRKRCLDCSANSAYEVLNCPCTDWKERFNFYGGNKMIDQNPRLHYDFPPQADTRELKPQEYYLVVSSSGDIFKTKFKPEFLEVSKWNNILFSGIVSNNQTLFYLVGEKEYSEKIKSLTISDPFSKDGCFHFTDLKNPGHILKKIWVESSIPKRLRL